MPIVNHSDLKLNTISGTAGSFREAVELRASHGLSADTDILSRRILCYFFPFSWITFLNSAIISVIFSVSLFCSPNSHTSTMNICHFLSPVYGFQCTWPHASSGFWYTVVLYPLAGTSEERTVSILDTDSFKPEEGRQHDSSKRPCQRTTLHLVTTQKTAV